jgi:hypothetical protein
MIVLFSETAMDARVMATRTVAVKVSDKVAMAMHIPGILKMLKSSG